MEVKGWHFVGCPDAIEREAVGPAQEVDPHGLAVRLRMDASAPDPHAPMPPRSDIYDGHFTALLHGRQHGFTPPSQREHPLPPGEFPPAMIQVGRSKAPRTPRLRQREGQEQVPEWVLLFHIEVDDFGEVVRLEVLGPVPNSHLRQAPDPWG